MKRLDVLDGLRAVSVGFVILSHLVRACAGYLPSKVLTVLQIMLPGPTGVRFFFVISGFVITLLLCHERAKTGSIHLAHFFQRRAARLLPAMWVFIALTATLYGLSGMRVESQCLASIASILGGFFANCGWNYGHLWSLTVEAMYYLACR